MTTNRIVYVPAHWAPIGKNKTVKVPTGEKKVGFFGGEKDVTRSESQFVQTGTSDCDIDAKRLADDIAKAGRIANVDDLVAINGDGFDPGLLLVDGIDLAVDEGIVSLTNGRTADLGVGTAG